MAKKIDLDVRPNVFFKNYDYTDAKPNKTSPGGGLYHGNMNKYKSVEDFLKKQRKQRQKSRKKALQDIYNLIIKDGDE